MDTIQICLLALLVGATLLDLAYRWRLLRPPDPMPDRDRREHEHHDQPRRDKHRQHGHGGHGSQRPPYGGGQGGAQANGGQDQGTRRVFP